MYVRVRKFRYDAPTLKETPVTMSVDRVVKEAAVAAPVGLMLNVKEIGTRPNI